MESGPWLGERRLYSWTNVDEATVDRLLDQFDEIPLDRAIAEEAGRIRRIKGLRLPDAVIAATAIVGKRPLLTRNKKDFKKVKRLSLHP